MDTFPVSSAHRARFIASRTTGQILIVSGKSFVVFNSMITDCKRSLEAFDSVFAVQLKILFQMSGLLR